MPNTRQFEERETRFARFDEELANRRHYMAKRMTNYYEVDATQPWGQLILFLDGVEHKLYSGYYQHLYEKARTRYESGATFLDPYEAFRNVLTVALHSMHSSSMAVYRLPDLMNAHLDLGQEVFSAVRHLGTRSIYEWIQDGLSYWGKPVSAGISQLGSLMDHMTSQSGFYRAFTTARNTTTAFEWPLNSPATILDHVWNNGRSILTDMRDEPDKYPSPADTFRKAREVIIKRYTEPYGGPNSLHQKRIEMNWISLQSIGWKVYHTLYPSQVTRQVYQRFILDSNCDLLDGLVNLLVSIVQYCASVTTRNQAKMMDLREDNMFELYMAKADKMRHKIVGWAHDYGSRPVHPERPKTDDDPSYHRDSKGHIRKKWIWSDGGDELSWSKPRLAPVNETRRPRVDDKTWKHAQMHKRSLAAQAGDNIWFYDTVLAWVDGITGWNLERGVSDWVVSFKAWIANPSVSACDYPNVGFRYWVTFWLRCEFPTLDCPNSNLNCSIGIGFEEALKWVLIVSAVLFLAMPFILPQTMLPLTAVSAFILYLIVWPALAWHYSPRCWLMSPSIVYGGVSIPVFGPMAPPALPQCAMDEVSNFLDKWISSCYSWLWPACMVIGDPCPAAPTSIDLANCKDVGIGDGLTNLVYIGYKLFGTSFTDVVTGFFETCLTSWSPFLSPWIRRTVEHFVNPTDTQQCRMDICFWPTLPAILFPFMLLGYAIALLSFLLPPIMAWIGSLFTLILLSPLGAISPTSDGNFFNSTSSSTSPAAVGDAIVRISQQIGDRQRRRRQARRAAELTHALLQIRHEQHLRHRGVGRRRESEE
jgi:hypothetical protein